MLLLFNQLFEVAGSVRFLLI